MDYTVASSIFVTTEIIGFHSWPEAPEPVHYLSNVHRHKFGIRVELAVVRHDREVEFHMLKRDVDSWLHRAQIGYPIDGTDEMDFGGRSCEDIATYVLDNLRLLYYPGRAFYRVTVNEDGENGATVMAMLADSHE